MEKIFDAEIWISEREVLCIMKERKLYFQRDLRQRIKHKQ